MSYLLLEFLDSATAVLLLPNRKTPSVWATAFVLVFLAGILVIVAAN